MKPEQKKIITLIAMILIAANTLSSIVDLSRFLPDWLFNPIFGKFSLMTIAAIVTLIGAWWIYNKEFI